MLSTALSRREMLVSVLTELSEPTHIVRIQLAVNAQRTEDVLRSSSSLEVAEGETMIVDVTERIDGKRSNDWLPLVTEQRRDGRVPAAAQSQRIWLLLTPPIIVAVQLEPN
jgi:hypothetical protein